MSNPRRHHYINKQYLVLFSDEGHDRSRLWGHCKKSGRSFASNPTDLGQQRDFFRLEAGTDIDPLELERAMGSIEEPGLEHVRNLDGSPSRELDKIEPALAAFIALHVVRVPGFLRIGCDMLTQFAKAALHQILNDPERCKEILGDEALPLGDNTDQHSSATDLLKNLLYDDLIKVNVNDNYRLSPIVQHIDLISELLSERTWHLVSLPEEMPEFVCSDRPACLSWIKPNNHGPYPPGFGLSGTIVTFPISKRTVIFGVFDDVSHPDPTEQWIGTVNGTLAHGATQYIYSSSESFTYTTRVGDVSNTEEFLRTTKANRDVGKDDSDS